MTVTDDLGFTSTVTHPVARLERLATGGARRERHRRERDRRPGREPRRHRRRPESAVRLQLRLRHLAGRPRPVDRLDRCGAEAADGRAGRHDAVGPEPPRPPTTTASTSTWPARPTPAHVASFTTAAAPQNQSPGSGTPGGGTTPTQTPPATPRRPEPAGAGTRAGLPHGCRARRPVAPSRSPALSATVAGGVEPDGLQTSYLVEFGKSTAYGHSSPSASAGAGQANVAVRATLTGLRPRTVYHYRLVAINAARHRRGRRPHVQDRACAAAPAALLVQRPVADHARPGPGRQAAGSVPLQRRLHGSLLGDARAARASSVSRRFR